MSDELLYDIFSGDMSGAVWQCSAESLHGAKARMNELAAQRPGKYFILLTAERSVVMAIDTTNEQNAAS